MKKFKNIVSITLLTMAITGAMPAYGQTMPLTDTSGFSPIEHYQQQEQQQKRGGRVKRSSDAGEFNIPGGQGTLTANAWRSTSATKSGNTLQWDYQVSAVYSGSKHVEKIRTTWQGQASLKNSASISLGIGGDSVSAGGSSSWQTTKTVSKYWENTDKYNATSADYRSNMTVSPAVDYRSGTISITNTASVKLKGDPKTYSYSASC